MRHLTKRAEVYASTLVEPDLDTVRERVLACTGERVDIAPTNLTVLPIGEVQLFLDKGIAIKLPDCPKCAVLWDQAVAAGEVVKQAALNKAAWIKADEDDNETFWETLNTGHKYRRSDT